MRYNVHQSRNRIARYLGVLVAATLVAVLGLPSAAQAQTPAAPTVVTVPDPPMDGAITDLDVMYGPALDGAAQMGWRVEYSEPGEAAKMTIATLTQTALSQALEEADGLPAGDPRIHHGVWRFRVSYWTKNEADTATTLEADKGKIIGMPSAWTSYHHGPPTVAPTGLIAYNAGPDARRLVWDEMDALTYQSRYTADQTDDDKWTEWEGAKSGETVAKLTMGTEYTFEVRGIGASRAGVGDLHGPSASINEAMPMPTPTLPEIALLLLAMLLLGSGVYLLRGRQSGGLTHA